MVDRSYAHSVREFFGVSFKNWILALGGGLAGLAGWIFFALGIQTLPAMVSAAAGSVVFIGAVFRAFHDARVQRDQLAAKLAPAFEFSDTGDGCQQDGVSPNTGIAYKLRRVRIRNSGFTSVHGVRLSIVGIRPDASEPRVDWKAIRDRLPVSLKPQHMKDAKPHYAISLTPGEPCLFDVVSIYANSEDLVLQHTVDAVPKHIFGGMGHGYVLDIQVVGTDVPPTTRTVRIMRGQDNAPFLKMIE